MAQLAVRATISALTKRTTSAVVSASSQRAFATEASPEDYGTVIRHDPSSDDSSGTFFVF